MSQRPCSPAAVHMQLGLNGGMAAYQDDPRCLQPQNKDGVATDVGETASN